MSQGSGLSQVNFRMMQPPALGDKVAIEILAQGIDLAAIQEGVPPVPQIMAPALLGRSNVPRAHIIDAHQEQHHLGPQGNKIILQQDEVPVGGGAIQAGVVDPHPVKLSGEFLPQEVRPGQAVGEVETLRGAAADGDDGEIIPEIGGRLLPPEAQGIFGVDRGLGQLGGKFFACCQRHIFYGPARRSGQAGNGFPGDCRPAAPVPITPGPPGSPREIPPGFSSGYEVSSWFTCVRGSGWRPRLRPGGAPKIFISLHRDVTFPKIRI